MLPTRGGKGDRREATLNKKKWTKCQPSPSHRNGALYYGPRGLGDTPQREANNNLGI